MNLIKLAPLAIMTAGLIGSVACFTTKDTGDTDTFTDTDTDTDADTDTDTDADTDTTFDYNNYEGWESFEYAFNMTPGTYDCGIGWAASGTPVAACSGCEWAFDVYMMYDASVSYDNGTCHGMGADTSYIYGYTSDYYGYGGMLMMEYAGSWGAWTYADFAGSTFTYATGVYDMELSYYGYPGYYYTYYWRGEAEVY